jgi:hypothetical protein
MASLFPMDSQACLNVPAGCYVASSDLSGLTPLVSLSDILVAFSRTNKHEYARTIGGAVHRAVPETRDARVAPPTSA